MFTKTMNVTRCSVEKESEKYNIFIFTEEDGQNFYIERKGYDNLYYICNVPEKDKLDNSLKFIEENIDIFCYKRNRGRLITIMNWI